MRKKHKRGFHQFIKYLEKNETAELKKPLSQSRLDHEEWALTREGYRNKKSEEPIMWTSKQILSSNHYLVKLAH